MIYALTALFVLAFVFYQKYQKADLILFAQKGQRNTKWKLWANVLKGCFLGLLFLLIPWQNVLIVTATIALVFELLTNKIGLQQSWFFVGSSSQFDKLGKRKWWLMFSFLLVTIFIKYKTFFMKYLNVLDTPILHIPFGVYLFVPLVFIGSLISYYNSDKEDLVQTNRKPALRYKDAAKWAAGALLGIFIIDLIAGLF